MSGQDNRHESFEELLLQFDEIVTSLETDDLSLEEAIERYELAARLAQRCTTILEKAELKVRQIDEALDSKDEP